MSTLVEFRGEDKFLEPFDFRLSAPADRFLAVREDEPGKVSSLLHMKDNAIATQSRFGGSPHSCWSSMLLTVLRQSTLCMERSLFERYCCGDPTTLTACCWSLTSQGQRSRPTNHNRRMSR
jgi:hypothetical protein